MGQLKTVELEVSRDGILRTLADQFTKKTTFIGELLQNSRRAGATQIDIAVDVNTDGVVCFTLVDDGAGAVDFTSLFTLGKSGWDEDTINADNPFGVGFASVLHASKRVSIQSTNGGCDFSVEDALACKPIAISESVRERGSAFTLQLNSDFSQQGDSYLLKAIKDFVLGFPVPVSLNGEPIPRPYAINSDLDFVRSELGDVAIIDLERGPSASTRSLSDSICPDVVFVQGLPVRVKAQALPTFRVPKERTVLHIDHADFRPRMPDRVSFCDEDSVVPVLKAGIVAVYREALLSKLGEFSDPGDFVDLYANACVRSSNADLLNALPVTIGMLGMAKSCYFVDFDYNSFSQARRPLDMDRPYFLDYDFELSDDNDPEAAVLSAAWQYAVHQEIPLIRTPLDNDHLAYKHALRVENLLAVVNAVDANEPVAFLVFDYIDVEIVVCDSVSLSFDDDDDVEVLPPITISDEVVFANKILYVPSGCADSELDILETVSNYQDENYSTYETLQADDTRRFIAIVHALRGGSAKDYLQAILNVAEYCADGLSRLGAAVVTLDENGKLKVE